MFGGFVGSWLAGGVEQLRFPEREPAVGEKTLRGLAPPRKGSMIVHQTHRDVTVETPQETKQRNCRSGGPIPFYRGGFSIAKQFIRG